VGAILWLPFILLFPIAIDGHAYFAADPANPYGIEYGTTDAYYYSPAFAQAITPLRDLGWDPFRTAWRLFELVALVRLVGPFVGPMLALLPVLYEINLANIHLLLALVMVLGFRWPALWSFVLLTKVTPGIGLIWFAVRREWRSLAIALGTTAAIVAVSVVALGPGLWVDWIRAAMGAEQPEAEFVVLPIPLVIRVVLGAAIVAFGATRNWRWTIIVAGFVALPVTWAAATSMLVAIPAAVLATRPARRWWFGWVRGDNPETPAVDDDHRLGGPNPVTVTIG